MFCVPDESKKTCEPGLISKWLKVLEPVIFCCKTKVPIFNGSKSRITLLKTNPSDNKSFPYPIVSPIIISDEAPEKTRLVSPWVLNFCLRITWDAPKLRLLPSVAVLGLFIEMSEPTATSLLFVLNPPLNNKILEESLMLRLSINSTIAVFVFVETNTLQSIEAAFITICAALSNWIPLPTIFL